MQPVQCPLLGKPRPEAVPRGRAFCSSVFLIAILKLHLIFATPFGKLSLAESLTETVNATDLSLRHEFFADDPEQPDLRAKVIQLNEAKGILKEFISFCKVFDEQMPLHEDEHLTAIQETIRICKKNGYLVDYLRDHEEEVERLMMAELMTRYTPVEADRKTRDEKIVALALLKAGNPDQTIKQIIMEMCNRDSEEYAQNILDYVKENPDPKDWY